MVGTIHWLTKKGSFQSETTILSADSEFFVQINLRSEDKILVDFFSRLGEKANQNNPVFEKFPFLEQWNQRKTRKDIQKILPLKMEFTGRVMEEDFRGAVGFSFYNNAAALFYAFMSRAMAKEGDSVDFQGRNYLRFVEGTGTVYLSLDRSLLYVTNTEPAMRDLLEHVDRPAELHSEEMRLDGLDLARPIYGFVTGRAIDVSWWPQARFSREEEAQARAFFNADRFSRIGFEVFLESEEQLGARVLFDCVDGVHDPEIEAWIEKLPEQILDQETLNVTSQVTQTAKGYCLAMTVSGLEQLVPSQQTIRF